MLFTLWLGKFIGIIGFGITFWYRKRFILRGLIHQNRWLSNYDLS